MFSRENWPGIALIGLCAIVAIALLVEIFTDVQWEFDGPDWAGNAIAIVGFGLVLFMSWQAWGKRLLGRKGKDDDAWTGNDVRSTKRRKDDDPDNVS